MKKTIIKMRLATRAEFVNTLEKINLRFSEPYWQHDRIFVPRDYSRDYSLPRISLRTTVLSPDDDAIYSLVLRRHISNRNLDYYNSTLVSDYTEAAHMLYQLGYELKAEFGRRRQELAISDTVHAYIDQIDKVNGYFAKFESDLGDNDDPELAHDDLLKTFAVLGVEGEPIMKTYGELFLESKSKQ